MWQNWTTSLLGLAIIVVPFLGLSTEAFTWTLALIGIAVVAFAVWGAVTQEGMYDSYTERMT